MLGVANGPFRMRTFELEIFGTVDGAVVLSIGAVVGSSLKSSRLLFVLGMRLDTVSTSSNAASPIDQASVNSFFAGLAMPESVTTGSSEADANWFRSTAIVGLRARAFEQKSARAALFP